MAEVRDLLEEVPDYAAYLDAFDRGEFGRWR
jgi:hypothetical protein